jgi:hypothetical protein
MIENLRKYTGLIIVFFVLVLIGFLFTDYGRMQDAGTGAPYIKVAGRNYTDAEYNRFGQAGQQLTQGLMRSGDYQFFSFLVMLSGNEKSQEERSKNFFANRMLLRSAKEEFGVYPGEEEIDTYIRKIRIFASQDGAFSQEQYRNFIEKGIGRLGLTEADIRELVSDLLAQEKISEILASGLSSDRELIAKQNAIDKQRLSAQVARLDLAPIKESIKLSDEEVKAYWETIQDAFMTSEKRKFRYFLVKPEFVLEPAEIAALGEKATEEEKAAHTKATAERTAKIAEDRRKAQLEAGRKLDAFLIKLEDPNNGTFEQIAQNEKYELKQTELFALADAPAELKTTLRGTSSEGNAADALFRLVVTSDPASKISPPIGLSDGAWLVASIDQVEESRVKTFEEARSEALAKLTEEKASGALKKAAEEAIEKIKAALATGKNFADAAKEAGITNEIVAVPEVTSGYQGDTTKVPANLFDAAKLVDPAALAEPILEAERAFLVLVEKREFVKNKDTASAIDAEVSSAVEGLKMASFSSWIAAKNEAANVEILAKH